MADIKTARFWLRFVSGWIVTMLFLNLMTDVIGSPEDMSFTEGLIAFILIQSCAVGAAWKFAAKKPRKRPADVRGFEVIAKSDSRPDV